MHTENKTAASSASDFRNRHSLGDAPIRDVIQVAEDFCGALVMSRQFPDAYEAFTIHDELTAMTIIAVGINANCERQRFSLAHEIGHLQSGHMSTDIHSLSDYKRNPEEIWADDFARHLLLPLSAIEAYLITAGATRNELTKESVSDLVRVFGIAPKPTMIQLRDSSWISRETFVEWQRDYTLTSEALAMRYGWSSERNAMVRVSQTPRRPTGLVQAAMSAYQSGATTIEALAQSSGEKDIVAFQEKLTLMGISQPEHEEPPHQMDDLSGLLGVDR